MHLDICLVLIIAVFKHKPTFLFFLVFLNFCDISYATSYYNITHVYYSDIIQQLKYSTNANIYIKGSHLYNNKRRIHNGLCDNLFPDVIVEPKSTYDVSEIVKISLDSKIPLSVRSGGHSYVCGSVRNGRLINIFSNQSIILY